MDNMIASSPGQKTILSGPDSKSMTHYLRMKHDVIVVGVGTAVADDPSLNCRYPGTGMDSQPRPVVIDPHGRWDVDKSKAQQTAMQGLGQNPWMVYARRCVENSDAAVDGREKILLDGPASMSWREILYALKRRGINSVMVEGGANVISSLLAQPELINSVIITVAPTWLGKGGVKIDATTVTKDSKRVNFARLKDTAWLSFGDDAVLCGRMADT
ncbi:dihydrofolate reductase [Piedraia hortae CBS 480.64]|uniref:2,5-diamino-6-ribosylamino-4(3H)-pyrimidinone 5'-phosphate reductase n=1 Tax=Piedraia hortae CBS 480.64 TaxID=1314780 RepID=A0A6A7BPY2_9PEZI|nr:dihydrofolate reductase [Piedraia hortae CBS 480.64]